MVVRIGISDLIPTMRHSPPFVSECSPSRDGLTPTSLYSNWENLAYYHPQDGATDNTRSFSPNTGDTRVKGACDSLLYFDTPLFPIGAGEQKAHFLHGHIPEQSTIGRASYFCLVYLHWIVSRQYIFFMLSAVCKLKHFKVLMCSSLVALAIFRQPISNPW